MSRKNRKTRTTADTADRKHLHAVADSPSQPTAPTTEDKVRQALADHPASTTTALAMAAGVGRSTAAKILARWGRDGTVIRTAGDGPRNPDTWAPTTPDRDTDTPVTEDAQADTAAMPDDEGPTQPVSGVADATAEAGEEAQEAEPDDGDSTIEDTLAEQEPVTGTCPGDAVTGGTVEDIADDEAATPAEADSTPKTVTTPAEPGGSTAETGPSAAELPAVADTSSTIRRDKNRLPKGGLRALVEEYLTGHPGESFGPAKIGADLGRSGGAVNNACEKLVADGYAIKTCEAPKRFAINPAKTDVADTAEGAEPEPEA